jgi:hypothetical protein
VNTAYFSGNADTAGHPEGISPELVESLLRGVMLPIALAKFRYTTLVSRESPRLRLPDTAQSNAMVTSAIMVGTSPDQPLCALALMPETAVHPGG